MSFSTLLPLPMSEDVQAACDDCEWTGLAETCSPIRNPSQRLNAGSEVPAGECPVCGCLAYVQPVGAPGAAKIIIEHRDGEITVTHGTEEGLILGRKKIAKVEDWQRLCNFLRDDLDIEWLVS